MPFWYIGPFQGVLTLVNKSDLFHLVNICKWAISFRKENVECVWSCEQKGTEEEKSNKVKYILYSDNYEKKKKK